MGKRNGVEGKGGGGGRGGQAGGEAVGGKVSSSLRLDAAA